MDEGVVRQAGEAGEDFAPGDGDAVDGERVEVGEVRRRERHRR